jgi:hypothetical protein
MKVHEGRSTSTDSGKAVAEATSGWSPAVEMIFAFHSAKQDAAAIASELGRRFPAARIVGCTTAGELLGACHSTGSLVVAGLETPRVKWSAPIVRSVVGFDAAVAAAAMTELLASIGRTHDDLDRNKHFCIMLIDGLSGSEEGVTAAMAEALSGVPLIGGSAGDDLAFKKTSIIAGDRSYSGSVVFVLAESDDGFEILKHQHFVKTNRYLAVTRVAPGERRILEIDGMPAAEAYARAIGIAREDFTADVAFANPLTMECNGELYVRSVQRVDPDGSIAFYCAVDEGMVLDVGGHEEIDAALSTHAGPNRQQAGFMLVFNCILRALEADKTGKHEALGRELGRFSDHVIGFDTYGEQLNGLHINQTVLGVVLGGGAAQ